MNLAQAIKTYRTGLYMSLQTVADLSGLSKTHVWEIESGKVTNPTARTLLELADTLRVTPAHLMQCAVISILQENNAKECDQ